ncbi:DUF4192 domain-containing protein [Nocardiopsis akebiae]|uniref:DUF4192 domain-containing protein n=1 Tax=Nocardiopsis akebiae TaxID=2831968 RepID=A0ABX8CBP0_9ACTN|nr:DUF4192 domain-containing protein [Nocardiopsis akebiae]QUX30441.1 DUF4192 domain-containing protein [Nocardiopsis akebiae]
MHSDQPHHPLGPSDPRRPLDSAPDHDRPAQSDRPTASGRSRGGGAPVPPPRSPGGQGRTGPAAAGTALTLTNPTDVIATLPYLVGTPPDPGIVVLAVRDKGVHSAFCGDLDRLAAAGDPLERAVVPVDMAAAEGCTSLVVVAYGPPERVTPHVDRILSAARSRGLTVVDALRVTGGRYWSYTCARADCCPVEGTVVNVDSSTVPASAVLHGIVPVQPLSEVTAGIDRVREVLRPVHGPERTAMDEVAGEVQARARRLLDQGMRGSLTDRGLSAVLAAVRAEREGRGVTDREELAWLGVYLGEIRVRDEAWARITAEAAPAHQELWARLARHLPRHQRAAPASLLAVAAWQRGDEPLAAAALEVALDADPGYSMAVLMSRALAWGLPVERWREFTPRWLRARSQRPRE